MRHLVIACCASLGFAAAPAQAQNIAAGQRVVGFPASVTEQQAREQIHRTGAHVTSYLPHAHAFLVRVRSRAQAATLEQTTGARYVRHNPVRAVTSLPQELTDYPDHLWHLRNPGLPAGADGADVGVSGAWPQTMGAGALVAVIDSGVDVGHPDLAGRLWINRGEVPGNGRDDDGNGYVDDVHGARTYGARSRSGDLTDGAGHGTFVAGLAVAAAGQGAALGVAPQSQVMAVKAIADDGTGTDFAIAEGVNYALDHHADVINLSLSGPEKDAPPLVAALARAEALGVPVIAAAGNESSDNDRTPSYPANEPFSNIISVSATDRFDTLAAFSNHGRRTVDLSAPGENLTSTYPRALTAPDEPYAVSSGTSAAAPVTAGAVAMIRSVSPSLNGRYVRRALLTGADPLPELAGSSVTGGRLDITRTLQALSGDRTPTARPRLGRPSLRGRQLTVRWTRPAGATRFELICDGKVVASTGSTARRIRLSRGRHRLQIMALDRAGNQRLSAVRTVQVNS